MSRKTLYKWSFHITNEWAVIPTVLIRFNKFNNPAESTVLTFVLRWLNMTITARFVRFDEDKQWIKNNP